jgi:hypothetical protein
MTKSGFSIASKSTIMMSVQIINPIYISSKG